MNIVRVFTIFKFCIPPAENIGVFECPTINTNKIIQFFNIYSKLYNTNERSQ